MLLPHSRRHCECDIVTLQRLTYRRCSREQRVSIRDRLGQRELHIRVLPHHRRARHLPDSRECRLERRRATENVLGIGTTAAASTATATATAAAAAAAAAATTPTRRRGVHRHAEL